MAEISSTGDQMLQLLEAVAFEGPKTTADLAVSTGINRTVAHRLLATLHARGYLSRQGKVFDLGSTIGQIAMLADLPRFLELMQPLMRQLAEAAAESVVLHKIDGDNAVVVGQIVDDSQLVRVHHNEGSRHSLAKGASGRAILAFQPPRFVQRIVERVEDPDLAARLEETRSKGYAVSHNELQRGVVGAAIPLLEENGVVRFSLAILVPTQRADRLPHIIEILLNSRKQITEAMAGFR